MGQDDNVGLEDDGGTKMELTVTGDGQSARRMRD